MAPTPPPEKMPPGIKAGDGHFVVIMEQTKIKKRLEQLERQGLNDRLSLLESQNLAQNIYKLAKAVEADAKAKLNAPSPCWDWTSMTEEEAGEAWAKLLRWRREVLKVRWPSRFWDMTTPCWYLHPEVVEELSALYLVWDFTFNDSTSTVYREIEFLERWLPGTHARVKGALSKCYKDGAAGRHVPADDTEHWRDHDDEAVGHFIQADLDARPSAPPAEEGTE
ncbi:hypothetical protein ACPC54_40335 [Kitasatospora sp. NPDC094028]